MHELAITEHIVDAVLERFPTATVIRVQLAIGKLSGVAPASVRVCFEVCAARTSLAGARLDIVETPGQAWCAACDSAIEVTELFGRCACGNADIQLLSGRDLMITEVEVT